MVTANKKLIKQLAEERKKLAAVKKEKNVVRKEVNGVPITPEAAIMLAKNLDPFDDANPGLADAAPKICDNLGGLTTTGFIKANFTYTAGADMEGVIQLHAPGYGTGDSIFALSYSAAAAAAPTAVYGPAGAVLATDMPSGTYYRIVAAALRVVSDGADDAGGFLRGGCFRPNIVAGLTSGVPSSWNNYNTLDKYWEQKTFTAKEGITVRRDFDSPSELDYVAVTNNSTCAALNYMPKVRIWLNNGTTIHMKAVIRVEIRSWPDSFHLSSNSPVEPNFDTVFGLMNDRSLSPIVVSGHSFTSWVSKIGKKIWGALKRKGPGLLIDLVKDFVI